MSKFFCLEAVAKLGSVDFGILLTRFSTFFWEGHNDKLILPPPKKSKIGQNNPQNRRILSFAIASLVFLFPFLCWAQTEKWQTQSEEEALFLNRIADFWEEGEYLIAKNQIQEFLTLFPNSSYSDSLCSALGDLLLREKNYASALDYYAKITAPEIALRIFPHRMQCLYSMQWYAILADECEAFLQTNTENTPEQLQITYYLAVALYHQCLNAENKSETLLQLAKRAEPYFETLFQTSLKTDVATAFAHLLCILKEFPKAASIYMDLAEKENSQESLFQAALIQAEYDKELALQTFQTIASSTQEESNQEQSLANEAAYNCLVLSFDIEKYNEILDAKENYLQTIPASRLGLSHLFFGRTLFALQKYDEAILEFQLYLETEPLESDTLRSALVSLVEIGVETQDLVSLDTAISKMESIYPNDEDLLKAKFSKARILRLQNKLQDAKQELEFLLALPIAQNPDVLFELIYLNNQMQDWNSCRKNALQFLSLYTNHEQALNVKHYLITASAEIAKGSQEGKQQLLNDLQKLLDSGDFLNEETKISWHLLLAQTFFSLNQFQEAIPILLAISEKENTALETLEASNLLLALCYRDGFQDLQNFTQFGEKALTTKNSTTDDGDLNAALYNAYLDLNLLEKAEDHLFTAFQKGIPIETKNVLWLAERYINQNKIAEGTLLLESITPSEETINEEFQIRLSKLYYQLQKNEQAASLLECLLGHYKTSPSYDWKHKNEALLLLGEVYASSNQPEKAKSFFDAIIAEKSNLKTRMGAAAGLHSARLQASQWKEAPPTVDDAEFQHVLAQLKDLVLQKNISHEPLYLEAALDYIDLQNRCFSVQSHSSLKKLALLEKTKRDFENTEDLLSKDYHSGRLQSSSQDFIYQSYMRFIEAEILTAQSQLKTETDEQKELQAKAKDLLLRIIEEKAHPALVARANQCLNQ